MLELNQVNVDFKILNRKIENLQGNYFLSRKGLKIRNINIEFVDRIRNKKLRTQQRYCLKYK